MGDENPPRTLGDYSRPSHEGYQNTIELPEGNNVVPLQSDTIRLEELPNSEMASLCSNNIMVNLFLKHRLVSRTYSKKSLIMASIFGSKSNFYDNVSFPLKREIDHDTSGKLCDKNAKESLEIIENFALYDHESWGDPKDLAKPVKEISLPQNVPSTSDCRLIELKNKVQRLMEAHLAPKPFIQVNKIASSCEICSGPGDTQYCMENPKQAFVDYASSHTNAAGCKLFTFKPE
nr:MAK10-like protein [Tanacetum cinerariifolium]